jgi:hypothetical protein
MREEQRGADRMTEKQRDAERSREGQRGADRMTEEQRDAERSRPQAKPITIQALTSSSGPFSASSAFWVKKFGSLKLKICFAKTCSSINPS